MPGSTRFRNVILSGMLFLAFAVGWFTGHRGSAQPMPEPTKRQTGSQSEAPPGNGAPVKSESTTPAFNPDSIADIYRVNIFIDSVAEESDRETFLRRMELLKAAYEPDRISSLYLQLAVAQTLKRKFGDLDSARTAFDAAADTADNLIVAAAAMRSRAYNRRGEFLREQGDWDGYVACKRRVVETFQQLDDYPLLGTGLPGRRDQYLNCRNDYIGAMMDLALGAEDAFLDIGWIHPSAYYKVRLGRPQLVDSIPCTHSSGAWEITALRYFRMVVANRLDSFSTIDEDTIVQMEGVVKYIEELLRKESEMCRPPYYGPNVPKQILDNYRKALNSPVAPKQ